MKNLTKFSLQDKPLPQWIVDKLRVAPARGEGCHPWIFGMACNLLPWRCETETFVLIRSAITDQRVSDKEISESIKNAMKRADLWQPGMPSKTNIFQSIKNIEAVPFNRDQWLDEHCPYKVTEEDIRRVSPAHPILEQSGLAPWKAAISTAFRSTENVCIQAFSNDPPPQKADSVSEWNKSNKVPGQFVCINPVKSLQGVLKKRPNGQGYYSVRCLDNILEQRYAPVEFDKIPIEDQLRIHSWLSTILPLLLLVFSGKRSAHGWYLVLGLSVEEVKSLFKFLEKLGVDKVCNDASRLTRLPGAIRHDRDESTGKIVMGVEQKLLYLDPHVSGAFKTPHAGLREFVLERGVK